MSWLPNRTPDRKVRSQPRASYRRGKPSLAKRLVLLGLGLLAGLITWHLRLEAVNGGLAIVSANAQAMAQKNKDCLDLAARVARSTDEKNVAFNRCIADQNTAKTTPAR
jgi:hypothetical protein